MHESIEKKSLSPPKDLHPDINALVVFANPYTAITTSIISTTVFPSDILEQTPIFPDYDSELITDMLHQLGVHW